MRQQIGATDGQHPDKQPTAVLQPTLEHHERQLKAMIRLVRMRPALTSAES